MFEKRKCKKLLKSHEVRLQRLKVILEKYSNLPQDSKAVLQALVNFFNDISVFQDEGEFCVGSNIKMEKYFPDAYRRLNAINAHIQNAGRSEYGWNRTKTNEQVTIDSVYLGDIHGVWTFTVRKWIYDTPENYTHPDIIDISTNKPIWLSKLIAESQARPFINSHIIAIEDIKDIMKTIATC